jgi:hypothetical protein
LPGCARIAGKGLPAVPVRRRPAPIGPATARRDGTAFSSTSEPHGRQPVVSITGGPWRPSGSRSLHSAPGPTRMRTGRQRWSAGVPYLQRWRSCPRHTKRRLGDSARAGRAGFPPTSDTGRAAGVDGREVAGFLSHAARAAWDAVDVLEVDTTRHGHLPGPKGGTAARCSLRRSGPETMTRANEPTPAT